MHSCRLKQDEVHKKSIEKMLKYHIHLLPLATETNEVSDMVTAIETNVCLSCYIALLLYFATLKEKNVKKEKYKRARGNLRRLK